MILKINTDEMEIISEDPMDAEYLESVFRDSVHIKKKSSFLCCGFHVTKERNVSVKFTKSSEKRG